MAGAKPSFVPFVVSFGGEPYFLDKDLEKARSWEGRIVAFFDGDGLTDQELVSFCESPPFDGGERVVIIDDAQKIKGDKQLKRYIETKNSADTMTVIVAIIRSEKLPEIWASAAKKGRRLEYKKLKTYEDNNEVIRWVEAEAKRLGVVLDKGVSGMLYQLVGADLHRLANELEKLQVITKKGEVVTTAILSTVISPSPTSEPWQVAEAAMEKDIKKAMNLLSVLYRNQGDEANVPLTYALMRQVEKAIVARQLLDRKATDEEISVAVGMHPWRCKNHFIPLVRRHGMDKLAGHMTRLCRLDESVKSSARSKRTLVELAVLSIAG
jgi:DNA polymerase-3 subunit delta